METIRPLAVEASPPITGGNYWIGGYEKRHNPSDPAGQIQDGGPQATLISHPLTISSQSVSFLIGGGCDINTERVELLVDSQVVQRATGKCTERMERVGWNVTQLIGRPAQIRLIDASSGGWGISILMWSDLGSGRPGLSFSPGLRYNSSARAGKQKGSNLP